MTDQKPWRCLSLSGRWQVRRGQGLTAAPPASLMFLSFEPWTWSLWTRLWRAGGMLCAACRGSPRSWARAVRLLRPSLCGARGPGPALPAPDVLCGAREMRDAEPEVGGRGVCPLRGRARAAEAEAGWLRAAGGQAGVGSEDDGAAARRTKLQQLLLRKVGELSGVWGRGSLARLPTAGKPLV